MNISSIVIQTAPQHLKEVLENLRVSDICETHFHDDQGKIVVTIEGVDADEEYQKLKAIQNMQHILYAALAYSCNE